MRYEEAMSSSAGARVSASASPSAVCWPVQLEDTGTVLGKGSAGLVKLVRHKLTGQLYALKARATEALGRAGVFFLARALTATADR